MKAAVVHDTEQAPRYDDFADPVVGEGRVEAEVLASAVHVIVRTIAAGRHYSASTKPPFVPGLDGVVRLPDGRRVYAAGVQAPYGMLAERVSLPQGAGVEVPEGLSSATAAALVNPAGSSWIPLSRIGAEGKTVLVVGATGTSGLLAVQAAKAQGAARVVALGRNAEGLARAAELGADATVTLADDLAAPLAEAAGPDGAYDIVLDYLWGQPARAVLDALVANKVDPHRPVRFVNIGNLAGAELALPAPVIRSSAIEISGNGIGSFPLELAPAATKAMFAAALEGHLTVDFEEHPLSEVESAWDLPVRLVLVP
ncbi:quinone oxidoreductase family protein [Microlunatus flavus]|uniref:NADPH2:quinone reductase n=1 Tax=Microlunatus flavus TaxID=1036181 RepID=A0A1H9HDU5_9ACTN|nr:zinc-binding alcohol dehydrogenase family protein [Microlunatus flavus]SEQ60525.1 NADPH2:quinone reductase [Microlunatus flavus]